MATTTVSTHPAPYKCEVQPPTPIIAQGNGTSFADYDSQQQQVDYLAPKNNQKNLRRQSSTSSFQSQNTMGASGNSSYGVSSFEVDDTASVSAHSNASFAHDPYQQQVHLRSSSNNNSHYTSQQQSPMQQSIQQQSTDYSHNQQYDTTQQQQQYAPEQQYNNYNQQYDHQYQNNSYDNSQQYNNAPTATTPHCNCGDANCTSSSGSSNYGGSDYGADSTPMNNQSNLSGTSNSGYVPPSLQLAAQGRAQTSTNYPVYPRQGSHQNTSNDDLFPEESQYPYPNTQTGFQAHTQQSSAQQSQAQSQQQPATKAFPECCYHKALVNRMEFIQPPTVTASGNFNANTRSHNYLRVFIGQCRFETTAAEVRWLVHYLTNIQPVKVELRGTGCFMAYVQSQDEVDTLLALKEKLLFDHTGVWFARDAEQAKFLQRYVKSYVSSIGKGFRLPKDMVVLRDQQNVQEKSRGGQPMTNQYRGGNNNSSSYQQHHNAPQQSAAVRQQRSSTNNFYGHQQQQNQGQYPQNQPQQQQQGYYNNNHGGY